MDLMSITPSSDVIIVELKHPSTKEVLLNDEDNTPMTWTLYAPHTKEYKKVVYSYTQARMNKMRDKDGKYDPSQFNLEEADEETLKQIADVSKDWNITFGGEKPKFTKKVVKDILFDDKYFWIRPQLEEALDTYEVFTKV